MMTKSIKWLLISAITLLGVSCEDSDNGNGNGPEGEGVNKWIYDQLSEYYLWNGDVKAKNPVYSADYDTFFNSLLSTNRDDGKHSATGNYFYSYIDRLPSNSARAEDGIFDTSLGFDFFLIEYPIRYYPGDSGIEWTSLVVVSYIEKDSPAYEKGLRRGDCIYSLNGDTFDWYADDYASQYYPLLPASSANSTGETVTLRWFTPEASGESLNRYPVMKAPADIKTGTITPARIETDPLHTYKVITENAKKIGYLAYNSFETGGDNHPYDDRMKEIFRYFASENISDLVLDLRYNGGGYVSCCQLLTSMILPAGKAGSVFMKLRYNDQKGTGSYSYLTTPQMQSSGYGTQQPGVNLNLTGNRIYVLATGNSASASEALIHSLRSTGMTVYHIGATTEGKNVGMTLSDSDDEKNIDFGAFRYEMWPVTFYIQNQAGQSYSSTGLTPSASFNEFSTIPVYELGSTETGATEVLLGIALNHIATGQFSLRTRDADADASVAVVPGPDLRRHVGMKDTGLTVQ